MEIRKLERAEFERALKRGLGSAFLHVSEYGATEVGEELLQACLNNYVFDKQVDDSRHKWLSTMIDRTGRWQTYAEAIVNELQKLPEDPWDFEQLVWLSVEMFERGYSVARDALLEVFEPATKKYAGYTAVARAIVLVGGLPAFEMAARRLGQSADGNEYEIHSLYELACELFNQSELDALLQREPAEPHLRAFMTVCENFEENSKKRTGMDAPLTLREVFERVNSADDFKYLRGLRRFGRSSSESERLEVYDAFLAEDNPYRQYALLDIFQENGFPEVNDRVFELLNSDHDRLRHRIFSVLGQTKSPMIRDLSLKLIASNVETDIGNGLRLLHSNFAVGDVPMIFENLEALSEPDQVHWVSMSLRHLVDSYPDEPWNDVLLRLYDMEPCGFCRGGLLDMMISRKAAPAQFLFEAQWDACQDVKSSARGAVVR